MSYPKWKFSKKESVLVLSEEQEKELGKDYFESPVEAESEFDYEGKSLNSNGIDAAPHSTEASELDSAPEVDKPAKPKGRKPKGVVTE